MTSPDANGPGALVVVATPIGNLGDVSPRAVGELERADLLCCEDTRRTGRLLSHLGIDAPPLRRVDAHTEHEAVREIVARVGAGERVALVSDAGTPTMSDPGQRLVAAVAGAGLEVVVVPGPVALVAALVGSGLPTDRFVFEGFLPRRGRERAIRLAAVADSAVTTVLYESPKRVAATLRDLAERCGAQRHAVVARELTKRHEEFVRGTLAELADWAEPAPKGEIVVVVAAAAVVEVDDAAIVAELSARHADGGSTRDRAAAVAEDLGVGRRRVYELALTLDRER